MSAGTPHPGAAVRARARRGLYLLPSLFTFANLLCGYASVVMTHHGQMELASILILVAALLDLLDGRVARWTETSSEFGVQLDSLADVLSFGMAPAFLVYSWALDEIPRAGLALSFLFACCGATRLARFNIQHAAADRRFFAGLPIPMAACLLALVVAVRPSPLERGPAVYGIAALTVAASLLMVSTVRYRSFKGADRRRRRTHLLIPALGLAAVILIKWPHESLLTLAGLYVLSGPIARIAAVFRRPQPGGGAA